MTASVTIMSATGRVECLTKRGTAMVVRGESGVVEITGRYPHPHKAIGKRRSRRRGRRADREAQRVRHVSRRYRRERVIRRRY
jgi:hypothetical protein